MRSVELKQALRTTASSYAMQHHLPITSSYQSAILFDRIADAFFPASYSVICQEPDWLKRTKKSHQNVQGFYEMQSSNSSDALLMNIFCHPSLSSWSGVNNLFGFMPSKPVFGYNPLIAKGDTKGDSTEIDMAVGDYFVEAKFTEDDFTEKEVTEVQHYTNLARDFDLTYLPIRNNKYQNYQIIRNLLAAIQHDKKHLLLCDERRPDLVRRYFETVGCLKDARIRQNCRVIFWQEIQRVCGKELADFLKARYGIG